MKKYDVGVLGVWFGANYGSLLNGYATYKTLKSLGYSVLMVNKPNARPTDWEVINPHCSRFISRFYPREDISELLPYSRMGELNRMCDTFLAGSDQIWHYNLIEGFNFSFLLNFADDDKKKISFGTSFGHKENTVPPEMMSKAIRLFQRFHAISVREQSSADILEKVYRVSSTVTAEPVFCLEAGAYDEIAESSHFDVTEPYILTYILDPTPEIMETVEYYRKTAGMKSINILDGDPFHNKKMREIFTLPDTLEEPGAEDFVKLYQNASFVITDSFHGTCFSIIFEKPFLSIANYRRGVARFSDLLAKYDLLDRLALDVDHIPKDEKFLLPVDYTQIRGQIARERARSTAWLKNALETPKDQMPSIILPDNGNREKAVTSLLHRSSCTGCGACVSACPENALSLQQDKWGYYRSSINVDSCVNCGLCSRICPALKLPKKTNRKEPSLYAFAAADKKILESSSSGGIFPLLAEEAFKRRGCVAGAAWTDDLHVEHILTDHREELYKLQKSKYLQSYLGDFDRKIKEQLDRGRFVLFSGCPCQVTGLKAYLGREYDNLVTVDLLCGNSPSAEFFQKYLKDSFPGGVKEYQFRYKKQGWGSDCRTLALTLSDGTKVERRGAEQDDYQKLFHSHVMCPPHCEQCKYQALPRFGDITVGDFWGYSKHDGSADTRDGISAVFCNNEKGQAFFDSIPDEAARLRKKVPLEWAGGNGYAYAGHNYCSPNRDRFYEAIQTMPFSEAVKTALASNRFSSYPDPLSLQPLHYDTSQLRFQFDRNMWKEEFTGGHTVLTTKAETPRLGNYAVIPLTHPLVKGKRYHFRIRFKIKTTSEKIAFHVKESSSRDVQIIYTHPVQPGDAYSWAEAGSDFIAGSGRYDEFMIGSAQIIGEGRFFEIDYINISDADPVGQELKNQLSWMTNAANFLEMLSGDYMTEKKFDTFMNRMRGKKIAILKAHDKAGRLMQKAADHYGAETVFSSPKMYLRDLTEQEWQLCKTADQAVCCCVHGTVPDEREGIQAVSIWDLLK